MQPFNKQNPFVYPAGVQPGVDWNNPAVVGGQLRVSAIGSLGSVVAGSTAPCGFTALYPQFQIAAPAGGGTTNAVNATIDGQLGPTLGASVTGGNTIPVLSGLSTATDATAVLAGIFRVTSVSALQFIAGYGGGNGLCLQISAAGAIQAGIQFGTLVSSGVTAITGAPYFFAASIQTGRWNLVVRKLDSGQVFTTTSATAITMPASVGTAQILSVGTSTNSFNGSIAAFMASSGWASLPELLAWSADPWSFWYPQPEENWVSAASQGAVNFPGPRNLFPVPMYFDL